MFYENVTHFYYCPKSKLYYSSTEGVYYSYVKDHEPPFVPYSNPVQIESSAVVAPVSNSVNTPNTSSIVNNNNSDAQGSVRKPLTISLGNKVKTAPKTNVLGSNLKKVQDTISKWEDRMKEDDVDIEENNKTNKEHEKVNEISDKLEIKDKDKTDTQVTSVTDSVFVKATDQKAKEGSTFICYVCRRQFNSQEILERHEKESKLHQENLLKQKDAQQQLQAPTYRDRASERRALHGDSIPIDNKDRYKDDNKPRSGSLDINPIVNTSAPLFNDESNIGNKLIRKLGWNEGMGLGKDNQGISNPVALENSQTDKSGLGNDIKIPSIEYGDGYKESLMRAARARYEQISKNESN